MKTIKIFCCRPLVRLMWLMALLIGLAGCKTSRQAEGTKGETGFLSSKVVLTVPSKDAVLTVNGTMKLKAGERMQLSFLMPILRSEVARIDVTPEEVILVDRMGKRYVQASRQELKGILPKKATFQHLEKLLYAASRPGGKNTLTGSELGIPSLEKGKIELTDFSTKPFNLTPTQLSSRYQRVELYEILELLMSL
ncbi:MAG TPA: DUF4292 domain-containing protein [Mediterranea massiliensis]|uniref:DUF4292 domain-containing protein n=2 Tax=Mediterranea massiliensis TaxID=1841865 RepID=A0A921LD79_9BACT|nr:DUF4292 domain-containing protein [Mediterranea massiliensis]MBM6733957.1 DUF4292 domain-containing protein [Mediterranea massiliensis]HJF91302.1 DUF4292 domain-containing protein [Mediterranea massiliensis]